MKKMKRICSWVTAILVLIMAVLLIVSCISIDQSGSRPFSRTVIAVYAERLSVIGILCLLAVIIGLMLPGAAEKTKAIRDQDTLLRRYDAAIPDALKEQQLRRKYRLAFGIACMILSVYPVIYFTDPTHFTVTDVNGDILRAALTALVPTAAAMALQLLCRHLELASISREIEVYRSNGIKPGKVPTKENADPKKIRLIRGILLGAAIVMLVVGAFNGGAADVLGKAIRICTECIGLG